MFLPTPQPHACDYLSTSGTNRTALPAHPQPPRRNLPAARSRPRVRYLHSHAPCAICIATPRGCVRGTPRVRELWRGRVRLQPLEPLRPAPSVPSRQSHWLATQLDFEPFCLLPPSVSPALRPSTVSRDLIGPLCMSIRVLSAHSPPSRNLEPICIFGAAFGSVLFLITPFLSI